MGESSETCVYILNKDPQLMLSSLLSMETTGISVARLCKQHNQGHTFLGSIVTIMCPDRYSCLQVEIMMRELNL